MADAEGKCRVMPLVIGKIGHMGYEVFAGGVNGEGLRWLRANMNHQSCVLNMRYSGQSSRLD